MFGRLFIDDLMALAGYINGNKYSLKSPVILHTDKDPTNFKSDNLEYVEATDPCYIEYQEKIKAWKHQRNVELNPDTKYHVPGNYNVIIEPPEESDNEEEEEIQQKTLSVTLNGGCADGSKMYYYYTEDEIQEIVLNILSPATITA